MNCGDIEENPGVLDQCYSNNNFVTAAVLGVRNYVLLGTVGCVNLIELLLMLEVSETWTLNAWQKWMTFQSDNLIRSDNQ